MNLAMRGLHVFVFFTRVSGGRYNGYPRFLFFFKMFYGVNMKVGKEKGLGSSLIVTPPCLWEEELNPYVYGWLPSVLSSQFSFSTCVIRDNGYPRFLFFLKCSTAWTWKYEKRKDWVVPRLLHLHVWRIILPPYVYGWYSLSYRVSSLFTLVWYVMDTLVFCFF